MSPRRNSLVPAWCTRCRALLIANIDGEHSIKCAGCRGLPELPRFDGIPGRWRECDLTRSSTIPADGGVYAIYFDGDLGYIGSSVNVRARIRGHGIRLAYSDSFLTPWGQFRDVRLKVRRTFFYGDWATLELRLLRRLQPRYNRVSLGVERRA